MLKNRSKYWNKVYMKYWYDRVEEAKEKNYSKSKIIKGDPKTEGDEIYFNLFKKIPLNSGSILDLGCGWGRFFDYFSSIDLKIFGSDISIEMLRSRNLKSKLIKKNVHIPTVAEAEKIPYRSNIFDNVVCLGVFDATFQNLTLSEISRVLKIGGKAFVTGKNDDYFFNDNDAFNAELGAYNKGHPNYFTSLSKMIKQLELHKHKILDYFLFPRRGDFSKFKYHKNVKRKFYEYIIIFEKTNDILPKFSETFYSKFSKVRKLKEQN